MSMMLSSTHGNILKNCITKQQTIHTYMYIHSHMHTHTHTHTHINTYMWMFRFEYHRTFRGFPNKAYPVSYVCWIKNMLAGMHWSLSDLVSSNMLYSWLEQTGHMICHWSHTGGAPIIHVHSTLWSRRTKFSLGSQMYQLTTISWKRQPNKERMLQHCIIFQ